MENYYLALLVFLGIVAVFDIFVGVSNDAVNFLQSAVGSRIASFKTIMCVAAAGVLLGSTFSSGMMEVARSGIFYPQMFNFEQIMVIFFAVMVADIILLDAFNTLGLPTSTTVSIVFELLGSALAAACMTLWQQDASVGEIVHYINSSKALTIISGILISVVVAFITGALVQYVTRLIFTFDFERTYRRYGGVFAGLALTAIVYFLIMKGAKGASFMRPEWLAFMKAHTLTIVTGLFVGLSVIFQALIITLNTNVFKIVILSGTFALAFAFAGNDLVNFVGVPLAAWDAYKEWMASAS
ncbi:MAG: inorganic phosphate transporter, partial [Duodenibacillus sp.]